MRINYLSRQDIRIILHYLGYIMVGIGAILMVPIFVDLYYLEHSYLIGFLPYWLDSTSTINWIRFFIR